MGVYLFGSGFADTLGQSVIRMTLLMSPRTKSRAVVLRLVMGLGGRIGIGRPMMGTRRSVEGGCCGVVGIGV